MAEIVTLARPYAQAVFSLAKEENRLEEWSEMLNFLASLANDQQFQACIGDPNVSGEQLESLILSISGDKLTQSGKNFVKELVKNGRVAVLPQIAELYESLKADQGGMLEAQVTSAFPMSKAQVKELVGKLEVKFGKKITAKVEVNPELIGGVKIEIGDDVIDASVQAKLQSMAFALTR